MEFYCSLEDGVSCSGGIRISAENGISLRANCLVFAPVVPIQNTQSTSGNWFLIQRYFIHAEHTAFPNLVRLSL
jgi:hypothetical protein